MIVRDPAATRGNRWVRTASPQPRQRAGFWMTVRMQHYWRFQTSGPNPIGSEAGVAHSGHAITPREWVSVYARFEKPPGMRGDVRPAAYSIPNQSHVCPLQPELFGTPGPATKFWCGPIHNGWRSPSVSYGEPGALQVPTGFVPLFSMNAPMHFGVEVHPTTGLPVTTGRSYWSFHRVREIESGGAKYWEVIQVGTATLALYFATNFLPPRIAAVNRAQWVAQVLARVSTAEMRFRVGAPIHVDFTAQSIQVEIWDLLEWNGGLFTTLAAGSAESNGRGLVAKFRPTSIVNFADVGVPSLALDGLGVQLHENLAL